MRRSGATFAAIVAAIVMFALIAGISLTGRWPNDAPLERNQVSGILTVPPDQIVRIQVSVGEKDLVFAHRPAGGWLVDGAETERAVSGHIDAALRMLHVSHPTRVLKADEYSAAQVADFGLDPPRMLVSIVASDGKIRNFAFGEATPAQNAQYVRVIGQSSLYLLSRFIGVEWQLAADMAQRTMPADVAAEGAAARPGAFLLPVSIAEISAVEIVENGALTRFERDPAGDWFHHVGQHVHTPGGFVHKADPQLAPSIAAELTALEHASIERVIVRHPDQDMLGDFGLEHPQSIMLLYTRDSSRPVARIEFGKPTDDGFARYVRVQETDSVVTVPGYAAMHLGKLLQLAGARS